MVKMHALWCLPKNGTSVTLQDMTIRNSKTTTTNYGGGVTNNGTLTIERCVIRENTAESVTETTKGGGVMNFGTITLDQVYVVDNTAALLRGTPGC